MVATLTPLACAQCGRDAPTDSYELKDWAYGRIALRGDFPDVIDLLLLCPECVDEEHEHAFDDGGTC